MNWNLCFGFTMLLTRSLLAQGIAGPQQGIPGEQLTFRLTNGSTQLAVDRWVQELNPDRYAGNDYVSSFTLQMTTSADGTLTATAPAPGRYKLAAWRGSSAWEAYVLVRPQSGVPDIRGTAFVATHSPLSQSDKDYAAQAFALAKKAGMNWIALAETGFIDLDSVNLSVQLGCVTSSYCFDVITIGDLGWLIDEAHNHGLKVVLYPNLWARTRQPVNINTLYVLIKSADGTSFGDLPALLSLFPALIPAVMQAYGPYMLQMADVAQQHHAEALSVGNQSNYDNGPGSLLWSQKIEWKAMFAKLRAVFQGKLWISQALYCGTPADLDLWTLADAINAPTGSGLLGSEPACGRWPPPELDNLTAEQMYANMRQGLSNIFPIKLSSASNLPFIWSEFLPVPVDGVNRMSVTVLSGGSQAVRDNQEIVNYFEAQMRTVGSYASGFFFWASNLTSGVSNQDVLRQPALLSAVANWWDGDTTYFAPCLVPGSPPPGVLFQNNFDGACPLTQVPSDGLPGQTIQDSQDPNNHVRRVSSADSGSVIPGYGLPPWTDFTIKLRLRIVSGSANPAAFVYFRAGATSGFSAYSVHVHSNFVGLYKISPDQSTQLAASLNYLGGTLGRWYSLEITALGGSIEVVFDGTQTLRFEDKNAPLLRGGLSLEAYNSDKSPAVVDFDDIIVTTLGPISPAVNVGGVLNAASPVPGAPVAPGSLASVYGSNMSAQPAVAAAVTWPTWIGLGGASLWTGPFPAPVSFVSPGQINVQIPWELGGLSQTTVQVISDGSTSAGQTFRLAPVAPGVFSMNGQGAGQGAILIANSDAIAAPSGSVPGRNTRPAQRGDYLSIFCTGLGDVTSRPADGAGASATELSTTLATSTVTIGGIPASVSFSGLAPGFTGLYQVNVQVPADAPTGDAVPVIIGIGGTKSNTVTIAVQ